MSRLNDFFTPANAELAKVTIPAGQIRTGDSITIPLSRPAEYVDVKITQNTGLPSSRNDERQKRDAMDPSTALPMGARYFYSQAGTALERKYSRVNSGGENGWFSNFCRVYQPVCRPASGTWGFNVYNFTSVNFTDSTCMDGAAVKNINTISNGNTDWQDCEHFGVGGFNEDKNVDYIIYGSDSGAGYSVDRAMGFQGECTWMNDINNHEVIFMMETQSNQDFFPSLLRPFYVQEIDKVNKRIKHPNASTSYRYMRPYALGGQSFQYQFAKKGYKLTNTEIGQSINFSYNGGAGAYQIQFTGVLNHITDLQNQLQGGLFILRDPADPTKYNVGIIGGETGTDGTTSLVYDYYQNNYYPAYPATYSTNWEIWLPFDAVNSESSDVDIPVSPLAADDWGNVPALLYQSGGAIGYNFTIDAPYYQYRPNDWEFNNAKIEACYYYRRNADNMYTTYLDYLTHAFARPDLSKMKLREGGYHSAKIGLDGGSAKIGDWISGCWSDDGGTTWYTNMRDTRSLTSGYTNPVMMTGDFDIFIKRAVIKFIGGSWHMNKGSNGVNVSRWDDPVGYKAAYEAEDWVIINHATLGPLNNLSLAKEAYAAYWEEVDDIGNYSFGPYNTWIYNDSEVYKEYDWIIEYDRIRDLYEEIRHYGFRYYESLSEQTIKEGEGNWSLTADGTKVHVQIGRPITDDSYYEDGGTTMSGTVMGELNIVVTGKAK